MYIDIYYIVGFRDFFEFGFGFFFIARVLVGMPFHGELAVGFFEVIFFGIFVDLKDFVVVHTHVNVFPFFSSCSTLPPLSLSHAHSHTISPSLLLENPWHFLVFGLFLQNDFLILLEI